MLTAVGYLIHAGKRYILSAVALSLCVLTVGWSLTALTDSHPVELMIFSSGNGTTVASAATMSHDSDATGAMM